MIIDMNYVLNNLLSILQIPSPSGNTKLAIDFLEEKFQSLNVNTYRTIKGALVATIPGENDDMHRTLSAHVDTLGSMVKEIKSNGRLKLSQIGGYTWNSVEGEFCTIEASNGKEYSGTILPTKASIHVHGNEASKLERKEDNIDVRIDEKVKSQEDTETLGISVGDFVYLNPRTVITPSGFIKSRHLDDKAGVVAILGMVKYIVDNKLTPKYTTNFFISNYEEVGHGSSASIPEKTVEFIAIDMAAPGDGQTSEEYSVTICAKDSTGPYDFGLKQRLVKLAKSNNINYKVDIYPHYGSDASAALRAGWNFKHGLIGPGVDASHSHERTHRDGIENTIKLGIKYILE